MWSFFGADKIKTSSALGVEGTAAVVKIQAAVSTAVKFENLVQGVQSVEAGFAAMGRAAVAVAPAIAGIGLVAAGAFVAAQRSTIAFAQSIQKISAEAIKLGVSFQDFDAVRQRLDVDQRRLALGMAVAEHAVLWPLIAVVDRKLVTSPRAYAQATYRHVLFGLVLGRLA